MQEDKDPLAHIRRAGALHLLHMLHLRPLRLRCSPWQATTM